jgi:adenylate cyclase
LGTRADASPEELKIGQAWEKAFASYENRNFSEAKTIFASIYAEDPQDNTAKLYFDRCEKFISSPPPAEWDGVDNLTEK